MTPQDARMIADEIVRAINKNSSYTARKDEGTDFAHDSSRKTRSNKQDPTKATNDMISSLKDLSKNFDSVTLRWKKALDDEAMWVPGAGLKKAQEEYVESLDDLADANKGNAKSVIKSFGNFIKNNSKNLALQQKAFNELQNYQKAAKKLKKELESDSSTADSIKKARDDLNSVGDGLRDLGVHIENVTTVFDANGKLVLENNKILKQNLDASRKITNETEHHVNNVKMLHTQEINARKKMVAGLVAGSKNVYGKYRDSLYSRLQYQQADRNLIDNSMERYGVGDSTVYEYKQRNIDTAALLGGRDNLMALFGSTRDKLNELGWNKEEAFKASGEINTMLMGAGVRPTAEATVDVAEMVKTVARTYGIDTTEAMSQLTQEAKDNQFVMAAMVGKTDEEQLDILKGILVSSRITAKQAGLSTDFMKKQEQNSLNMRHAGTIKNLTSGIMTGLALDQYARIAKDKGINITKEDRDLMRMSVGPGRSKLSTDQIARATNLMAQYNEIMGESTETSSIAAFNRTDLRGSGGQIVFERMLEGSALSLADIDKEFLNIKNRMDTTAAAESGKEDREEFRDISSLMANSYNKFEYAVTKFDEAVNTWGKTVMGAIGALGLTVGGGLLANSLRKKITPWIKERITGVKPPGGSPSASKSLTRMGGKLLGRVSPYLMVGMTAYDAMKGAQEGYKQHGDWMGGASGAAKGLNTPLNVLGGPFMEAYNQFFIDKFDTWSDSRRKTLESSNIDPIQENIEGNTDTTNKHLIEIKNSIDNLNPEASFRNKQYGLHGKDGVPVSQSSENITSGIDNLNPEVSFRNKQYGLHGKDGVPVSQSSEDGAATLKGILKDGALQNISISYTDEKGSQINDYDPSEYLLKKYNFDVKGIEKQLNAVLNSLKKSFPQNTNIEMPQTNGTEREIKNSIDNLNPEVSFRNKQYGSVNTDNAGLGTSSPVKLDTRDNLMKGVYKAFQKQGISHQGIMALMGEIGREGSFKADNIFGSHTDDSNKATNVGLISWQKDRKDALLKKMKESNLLDEKGNIIRSQDSLNTMASFMLEEMRSGQQGNDAKNLLSQLEAGNLDPNTMMDMLGKHVIRWRIDDPTYRPGGIKNRTDFYNMANALISENSAATSQSSVWGATMDSIKNTVNAITTGKIKDENGNYISVTDQLTPAMLQVVENTLKTKEAVVSNTENRSEVAKENRLMSQYESKTKMEIEGRADQIRESFSNSMAPLSNTFNRIDNILGR